LRKELEHSQRILLIRLRSLGDAILNLPLIHSLKSWRRELLIDVLIEAPFAAVFRNHPEINEALIVQSRNVPDAGGWSRIRAAYEIRTRRYPIAMNLHGGTTSKEFIICSGARLRIGETDHRASWIYNAPEPPSSTIWGRSDLHTIEHQLSLMRWLDLPLSLELGGRLHIEQDSRERIQKRLAQAGLSKFILIQPTATLATKQWSASNFALLGDRIMEDAGVPIIYTAGPGEHSVLQEIQRRAAKTHRYWQDLSLGDLFALIDACHMFIGNDSGPTHAAAALKKRLVVIWGSSNFRAWRPWSDRYEAVRSDLPCMPCPGYTCNAFEEPKCIRGITVERVLEACEKMLKTPLISQI
jgi:ADP-heptose:LPS heptosyltransferase